MKDRGLAPITADKFTGAVDRMMRDPDVALNPTLAKALPQVRQMFDDWAAQNGVITPEAVYAIRKNGVSGVIQQLMPNADAQAQRRMAAEILGRLRPIMDETIEKAGGKGWKDYLRTFEQGMTQIDEMELAGVLQNEWRKGTPAARMPQVRGPEIKERAARLRRAGDEALERHLNAQIGLAHRVLMESPRMGRTEQFTEVNFGAEQPEGQIVAAVIAGQADGRLSVY